MIFVAPSPKSYSQPLLPEFVFQRAAELGNKPALIEGPPDASLLTRN